MTLNDVGAPSGGTARREGDTITTDTGFDYEVIARCQYGLLDEQNLEHDCGNPATYKVWWHPATEDTLFVCTEHFDEIVADEERNTGKEL